MSSANRVYKGQTAHVTDGTPFINDTNKPTHIQNGSITSRYKEPCVAPVQLNKKVNVSLDACVRDCENNPNCDFVSHTNVKGDPNRNCNLRYNDWNYNRAYPTNRPCIPEKGKNSCDMCFMYKSQQVNNNEKVHLKQNSNVTTVVVNPKTQVNTVNTLNTIGNNQVGTTGVTPINY